MVKTATLGLRIDEKVRNALEAAAKADHRTMASYVERLIIIDLEQKGFLSKGGIE